VTVQRADVPLFFARALAGAKASQTVVASAVAVAGGAGQIGCGAPVALAACVLEHDSAGKLICPANLSFQNGPKSVGLTHPDGTSPVNGSNTASYFREALSDPPGCGQEVETSDILYLQNGDDLARRSVDDINAATNDGESPVRVTVPVVDIPCGTGGPNYNRSAPVVGFVYMDIVGARWTDAAPPKVAAACPTLGMKNICVTGDCGLMQGVPGGGTINPEEVQVFLVH
jgi:hypothetical protein